MVWRANMLRLRATQGGLEELIGDGYKWDGEDVRVMVKGYVELDYGFVGGYYEWVDLKAYAPVHVKDLKDYTLIEAGGEDIPLSFMKREDKEFVVSKVFKLLTTIAHLVLGEKGKGYEFSLREGYWKVVGDSSLIGEILPSVYTVTAILSKLGCRCRVWKGKKSIRVNFEHYPSFLTEHG